MKLSSEVTMHTNQIKTADAAISSNNTIDKDGVKTKKWKFVVSFYFWWMFDNEGMIFRWTDWEEQGLDTSQEKGTEKPKS